MKTIITNEQKEEVKRLYLLQKHTIRQIMKLTGVRSEQTIYVILDDAHIPRFKTRNIVRRISVGIDEELYNIIEKVKPKILQNLSAIWQRKAIMPNLKKNNYEEKVFFCKIKEFGIHQR